MQINAHSGGIGYQPVPTGTPTSTEPVPIESPGTEAPDAKAKSVDTLDIKKGVLRNLLAGHYKGVADVRLRINFHDELQALTGGSGVDEAPDAEPLAPPVDPPVGEADGVDAPIGDGTIGDPPVEEEPAPGAYVLPDLSPPQGNGKAYAKFLAIYEDLMAVAAGGGETAPPGDAPDTVDVTA